MAVSNGTCLKKTLESFFSDEWILEKAREVGYVVRERKVDVVVLFWTILLAFPSGICRTIADMRRAFNQASVKSIAVSSFYDRWTEKLTRLLKEAVLHALEELSEPCQALTGKLSRFKDLVLADATVFRLHDTLEKYFPACRTNHTRAAAKLHVVMSVSAASPRSVKITGERTREGKVLRIGRWVEGRLLLLDLGYYDYGMFDRIERNGGFFISRLKDNANPVVVKSNVCCRGRSIPVEGVKLQDVLARMKRKEIDFVVEVSYRKRTYLGKRSGASSLYRLVGVMNDETGKYHLYLTNIPGDVLKPEDIARTYRTRWEVELLFKELKSYYRLDQFPAGKRPVVESLIYAAILTLIVSRGLLFAMRRSCKIPPSRSPERRWAAVFQSAALRLLSLITTNRGSGKKGEEAWKSLKEFLKHEMVDPNVNRWRNLDILRP